MLGEMAQGHHIPTSDEYSSWIVFWTYVTAFEQMLVVALVYYFVGGLIKWNKLITICLLSMISLELGDNLIRMTVMNFIVAADAGISSPLTFAFLSQLDQIVNHFLTIFVLVFVCPTKKYHFA